MSYRIGWGGDLDIDVQTTQALENMGIDMLHVSTGIPEDRKLQLPTDFGYNDIGWSDSHLCAAEVVRIR